MQKSSDPWKDVPIVANPDVHREKRTSGYTGRNSIAHRYKLTPDQYQVCRLKATEPPFSGKYVHHKENGMYTCVACGADLFSSDTKFESFSGWPSFWDVATKGNVKLEEDNTHGMKRTEVLCAKCGSHLGHVFPDGPKDKTGQRYCINSVALDFRKK